MNEEELMILEDLYDRIYCDKISEEVNRIVQAEINPAHAVIHKIALLGAKWAFVQGAKVGAILQRELGN